DGPPEGRRRGRDRVEGRRVGSPRARHHPARRSGRPADVRRAEDLRQDPAAPVQGPEVDRDRRRDPPQRGHQGQPRRAARGAGRVTIEAFEIRIEDAVLDDLRRRLEATRFPDQIEETGWEYGMPVDYLRGLVTYWLDGYDWRAQEARLNELAHFRARIDGQSVHFVHARSARDDALPLLLVHGWPGSIVEFLDVIPRLTGDFHVVAPSLPGYAFSEPTRTSGWNPTRIAR